MPHLIFQTKFPQLEECAEISFFGSVDQGTMDSLQSSTISTLKSMKDSSNACSGAGGWQRSPHSTQAMHLRVEVSGDWEARQTKQNVLRVAWMDVFEKSGWKVVSMWNSNKASIELRPSDAKLAGKRGAEGSSFRGECTNFLLAKMTGDCSPAQDTIDAVVGWQRKAANGVSGPIPAKLEIKTEGVPSKPQGVDEEILMRNLQELAESAETLLSAQTSKKSKTSGSASKRQRANADSGTVRQAA